MDPNQLRLHLRSLTGESNTRISQIRTFFQNKNKAARGEVAAFIVKEIANIPSRVIVPAPSDNQWNVRITELRKFIAKNGSIPPLLDCHSEYPYSHWLFTQVDLYAQGRLSVEKQGQLESLGIIRSDLTIYAWPVFSAKLIEWCNTIGKMPFDAPNTPVLSIIINMCVNMHANGNLMKKKQDFLNSFSPDWYKADTPIIMASKVPWLEGYLQLKAYVDEFKTIPKKHFYHKGYNLRDWLEIQIVNYEIGDLCDVREYLLNRIDPEWKTRFPNRRGHFSMWLKNLEDLKKFRAAHLRLPIDNDQERNSYKWLGEQRDLFSNGKLEFEKEKLLREIDSNVFGNNDEERVWQKAFTYLQLFYHKMERLPRLDETYENFDISNWGSSQVRLHGAGLLSREREILLLSVTPFIFKHSFSEWDENLRELKGFVRTFGKVPHKKNSYDFLKWISEIKIQHKLELIPTSRIHELRSIDERIIRSDREPHSWITEFEKFKNAPAWLKEQKKKIKQFRLSDERRYLLRDFLVE